MAWNPTPEVAALRDFGTKFKRNVERDARKLGELRKEGWKTLEIWECQIKKNLGPTVEKVIRLLRR